MKKLLFIILISLIGCTKEPMPAPVCNVDIPQVVSADKVFSINASASENASWMQVECDGNIKNSEALVCDYSLSDPGVFRVRVTVFAANGWSDRCDYYVEVVDSLY